MPRNARPQLLVIEARELDESEGGNPQLRRSLRVWLGWSTQALSDGDWMAAEVSMLDLRAVYGELTADEIAGSFGPWEAP
jgi:hypothetical protein